MINLRPVVLVTGALVAALGGAMLIPMLADLFADDPLHRADWNAFAIGAVICLFTGGGAAAASWGPIEHISVRQGFLLTATSWLTLVIFAAIPLSIGTLQLSYVDAFFEAMSGLTTTGATVIVGLDDAARGRAVVALHAAVVWRRRHHHHGFRRSACPQSRRHADFQKRSLGHVREVYRQRHAILARPFGGLCLFHDPLRAFDLWAFGMPAFDAANHAMTTVATGGYSTRDASIGAFLTVGRAPLDLVVTVFMIIGSLPFGIFLTALLRGAWSRLFRDSQIQFFFLVVFALTLTMVFQILINFDIDLFTAFRHAIFNVVSILTGTGYATTDYSAWGPFAVAFFFCIMFVGGCAGSTSCGMKIFRFQVAFAAMAVYARRLAHPRGVFVARYNGRPLTDDVFVSVLSFFFVYFASFATLAVILSGLGLDTVTALSGAGSAIANVGPGLGDIIGPTGTYAPLPDSAKLVLAGGMLLGRLEFFTILVLLSPYFWRN